MAKTCKIIIKDEVNVKLDGLDPTAVSVQTS